MPLESSNLADAFASMTGSLPTPATTEGGGVAGEPAPESVVLPIEEQPDFDKLATGATTPVTTPTPTPVATEEPTEEPAEGDVDYKQLFAKAIGFEGEIEEDTLDGFANAANAQINKYKEELEVFKNNETLVKVKEHLDAGYTLEEYLAAPKESTLYNDTVLSPEGDDVDVREAVYQHYYKDKLDEETLQTVIEKAKENGTFNAASDKFLKELQTIEKATNERIRTETQAEIAAAKAADDKFFAELDAAYANLKGVTVDKDTLNKTKAVSVAGNNELNEMIGKLAPADHAIINTLIVALSSKKAFQYNPTATVPKGINKPITSIFQTGAAGASEKKLAPTGSLKEMNDYFSGKSN